MISAGCAIGLGNVWRFPYIVGKYGGAAFVLIYLAFLLILGLPVMVAEFAVGRASQKSAACSFDVLEPKRTGCTFLTRTSDRKHSYQMCIRDRVSCAVCDGSCLYHKFPLCVFF